MFNVATNLKVKKTTYLALVDLLFRTANFYLGGHGLQNTLSPRSQKIEMHNRKNVRKMTLPKFDLKLVYSHELLIKVTC